MGERRAGRVADVRLNHAQERRYLLEQGCGDGGDKMNVVLTYGVSEAEAGRLAGRGVGSGLQS